MNKYIYSLFLISSSVIAMEQDIVKTGLDPALVPTYAECKNAMQQNDSEELVHAFAQHSDITRFNKFDYHSPGFNENELLSWCIPSLENWRGGVHADIAQTLLDRSVAQAVGPIRWHTHIESALNQRQENLAVRLLQAKPKIDVNCSKYGRLTLLQTAACTGAIKFATELLEGKYGAKVDACSESYKNTPLQLAAQWSQGQGGYIYSGEEFKKRQSAMLHLLLKHGANPDVKITRRTEGSMWSPSQAYTEPFVDWCVSQKFDGCLVPLVEQKKINGCTLVQVGFFQEKEPLLNWASRVGSLPLVQAMVPAGSKPSGLYLDNKVLLDALRYKHKDIVNHLATHPFTQRRKSTGQEIVRAVVHNGWLDTMQKVVAHYGTSICTDTDDWYRNMALLYSASMQGNAPMMRMLLDFGCDMYETDISNVTPLKIAVQSSKPDAVGVLLAQGAYEQEDVSDLACKALQAVNWSNEKKLGPLDQSDTLDQLFAYGADIQSVREHCVQMHGTTPLEYVLSDCSANKYQLATSLLEAGLDPNDFLKKSPICYAVENNDSELVALLLRHGADPDTVFEDDDSTAAYYVSADILSQLLNAGLRVHKDARGLSPLLHAVTGNTPEAVACLLDKSDPGVMQEVAYTIVYADISQTLFEYAVHQNRKNPAQICQLLLDRGADLERVNELGETPVFWAMRNNNAAALEWLVAQGVRLDVVNNKGETPLSFLACQIECTQKEMLMAVLIGLSASVGGLVSVEIALEHSIHYRLNIVISDEQVGLWKQSMKFDPFEKMRAYCGTGLHKEYGPLHEPKPTLATRIEELEQRICQHGAYLFGQKMRNAFDANDIETVRQFIATGADLRTFDVQHGATVLHWAARQGHQDLLVELLQKHGLKEVINKETIHRRTALSEAGNAACVQILLDNGAAITKNVLFSLMHKETQEVCSLILDKVNADTFANEDIKIIYDNAVQRGNVLIAQKFLELGAEPSEFDLEHAVLNQHAGIVTLLKSKGISVTRANEAAKARKYSSISSFAEVAVQKKDLALLKEVIETADSGLVTTAAYAGWHEGLAVLLDAGLKDYGAFSGALSAKSYECCKLLINDMPMTFPALDHALRSTTDCMRLVLDAYKPSQDELDRLLATAVQSKASEMTRLLIEEYDANEECCFNSVALQACQFGSIERSESDAHEHISWQRVTYIRWLEAWKKARLEGDTTVVLPALKNESIKEIIETLYALMTAPRYENAQMHKDALVAILQSASCPLAVAQQHGNSTTFNDLFDPAKVEQWYAAIDREYAAQSNEDQGG